MIEVRFIGYSCLVQVKKRAYPRAGKPREFSVIHPGFTFTQP
jgi:hypothetical protein